MWKREITAPSLSEGTKVWVFSYAARIKREGGVKSPGSPRVPAPCPKGVRESSPLGPRLLRGKDIHIVSQISHVPGEVGAIG